MIFGATGPFNAVVLSKTFPDRLRFQATTAAVMVAREPNAVQVVAAFATSFADNHATPPNSAARLTNAAAETLATVSLLLAIGRKPI